MINPPGGPPPWLNVLPPWLIMPYEAIQKAIDDWKREQQAAPPFTSMPPTTPFTTGVPKDPDEVPPIIHIPGPTGGIGEDVKGKKGPSPDDPGPDKGIWPKGPSPDDPGPDKGIWPKVGPSPDDPGPDKGIWPRGPSPDDPGPDKTPAQEKQNEIMRRLMEQQVIIGEPQGPGTLPGGGIAAAEASPGDPDAEWGQWSPQLSFVMRALESIPDPEERARITKLVMQNLEVAHNELPFAFPKNVYDYYEGGSTPSPQEIEEFQQPTWVEHPGIGSDDEQGGVGPTDFPVPDDFYTRSLEAPPSFTGDDAGWLNPMTQADINKYKAEDPEDFFGYHARYDWFAKPPKKEGLPRSPYQEPPQAATERAELNELRNKQLSLPSVSRWFEENAYGVDPDTGEAIHPGATSQPMSEEAELFLRRMIDAGAKQRQIFEQGLRAEPYDPSIPPNLTEMDVVSSSTNYDILKRLWHRGGAWTRIQPHFPGDDGQVNIDRDWNRLPDSEKARLVRMGDFITNPEAMGVGTEKRNVIRDDQPATEDQPIDRRSPEVAYRAWKKDMGTAISKLSDTDLSKLLGPHTSPDLFNKNTAAGYMMGMIGGVTPTTVFRGKALRDLAFNEANRRFDKILADSDWWATKPA